MPDVSLDVTAEISKRQTADYAWLKVTGSHDARAEEVARAWMRRFVDQGQNSSLVVLQRVEGRWWLIDVVPAGLDSKRRPTARAVVARLADEPPGRFVPDLLSRFTDQADKFPKQLSVSDWSAEKGASREPVAVSALHLALGYSAQVQNGAAAAELLDERHDSGVGLAALDWVARVSHLAQRLGAEQSDEAGLFLTPRQEPEAPEGVVLPPVVFALSGGQFSPSRLRLRDLAALRLDDDARRNREKKVDLFRLGLGQGGALPEPAATEVLAWLVAVDPSCLPHARRAAFTAVTDPEMLAELLAKVPDDQRAWAGLCGRPEGKPDREALARLLAGLPEALVRRGCTLEGSAWAAATGEDHARQVFRDRLCESMADCEAAALVLLGTPAPGATAPLCPALLPQRSWLVGVDAAGAECLLQSAGAFERAWWLEAVRILRALGRLGDQLLCAVGLARQDVEVLRIGGARPALQELAGRGEFHLPARGEEWPGAARTLLSALVRGGELWRRLASALGREEMIRLLELIEPELAEGYRATFQDLLDSRPIGADLLGRLAGALCGHHLLAQLLHLLRGAPRWWRTRGELIRSALKEARLDDDKRAWLEKWLLSFDPLPIDPAWTDAEALALLDALPGAAERMLRVAFSRYDEQPKASSALLRRFEKALRDSPAVVPPPPPSAEQQGFRDGWYAELAPLLGWEEAPASAPAAERGQRAARQP
jgi:hypothetical protein